MTFPFAFRRSIQHVKPIHIYCHASFAPTTHKFTILHLISPWFARSFGNLSQGQCGRLRIYCVLCFTSQFSTFLLPLNVPRQDVLAFSFDCFLLKVPLCCFRWGTWNLRVEWGQNETQCRLRRVRILFSRKCAQANAQVISLRLRWPERIFL